MGLRRFLENMFGSSNDREHGVRSKSSFEDRIRDLEKDLGELKLNCKVVTYDSGAKFYLYGTSCESFSIWINRKYFNKNYDFRERINLILFDYAKYNNLEGMGLPSNEIEINFRTLQEEYGVFLETIKEFVRERIRIYTKYISSSVYKKAREIEAHSEGLNDNDYVISDLGKLIHREIAEKCMFLNNRGRFALPFDNYEVHHLDWDKQNNDLRNLRIITREEHIKIHNGIS